MYKASSSLKIKNLQMRYYPLFEYCSFIEPHFTNGSSATSKIMERPHREAITCIEDQNPSSTQGCSLMVNEVGWQPWGVKNTRWFLPICPSLKPWWTELPDTCCWWEVIGSRGISRDARNHTPTPQLSKEKVRLALDSSQLTFPWII